MQKEDIAEILHRCAKRKWKIANKELKGHQRAVRIVLENLETPSSTPRSLIPVNYKKEELEKRKKYQKKYQRIEKSIPK